jgi:hypothetical protein
VVLIIVVVVASLIPRVATTLGHSRVNRSAYVIAADFLLAQSLAARQHMPVRVQIVGTSPDSLLVLKIIDAVTLKVLRTEYFDKRNSEFKLAALSATPTSVLVMPNGTTTAPGMVVTVGGADYYHLVRITQAGQVRITK